MSTNSQFWWNTLLKKIQFVDFKKFAIASDYKNRWVHAGRFEPFIDVCRTYGRRETIYIVNPPTSGDWGCELILLWCGGQAAQRLNHNRTSQPPHHLNALTQMLIYSISIYQARYGQIHQSNISTPLSIHSACPSQFVLTQQISDISAIRAVAIENTRKM